MATRLRASSGFTLIELALVMVIIGILAGGGVGLVKTLSETKARQEAADALEGARASLEAFAGQSGRLPWADTDGDGAEDEGEAVGSLPWATLSTRPVDPFNRALSYAVDGDLTGDLTGLCDALAAGLSGGPVVVEMLGTGDAIPAAAVIVSAGPRDADGDGDVFDRIAGSPGGDNRDGAPAWVRGPPTATFDDLLRALTPGELYEAAGCARARRTYTVTVANTSGASVYLHDTTLGTCLGVVAHGAGLSFAVARGDSVELRSSADYTASAHVSSTPAGPLAADANLSLSAP